MKLLPQAVELTTDVFGNFVLQKLLEIGSVEVKRVFAEQLVGDVLRLSLHAYLAFMSFAFARSRQ